jgi:hypothetical protein
MNLEKGFSKNLRKVLKGIFFKFDPFSVKQAKKYLENDRYASNAKGLYLRRFCVLKTIVATLYPFFRIRTDENLEENPDACSERYCPVKTKVGRLLSQTVGIAL